MGGQPDLAAAAEGASGPAGERGPGPGHQERGDRDDPERGRAKQSGEGGDGSGIRELQGESGGDEVGTAAAAHRAQNEIAKLLRRVEETERLGVSSQLEAKLLNDWRSKSSMMFAERNDYNEGKMRKLQSVN